MYYSLVSVQEASRVLNDQKSFKSFKKHKTWALKHDFQLLKVLLRILSLTGIGCC